MGTTYKKAKHWYFEELGFLSRLPLIEKHIPKAKLPLGKKNIIKLYDLYHNTSNQQPNIT